MVVEQRGIGAGTIIIRFKMRIFGRTQTFRATVTEPDPGCVLAEAELDTDGAVTTLTADPGPVPKQSRGQP